MNIRLFSLFLLFVITGGCTPYSKVKVRPGTAAMVSETGVVELRPLAASPEMIARRPLAALGRSLAAADGAAGRLQAVSDNSAALIDYNFALNDFFTVLHRGKWNVWNQPLRVPAAGGDYMVTARPIPNHPERHPRLYDYVPSANLEIGGSYVKERTLKPGLGAALVAVRREARSDAKERFTLDRAYYGVTAVARFKGRECEIEFADPLAVEKVEVGRQTFPLAADFTAPLALMLRDSNVRTREIVDLLRPRDAAECARIVRLQPFDPEKTTVLVVHGLASSSATWVPMLNALRGDPVIRRKFQFWFFDYPSGCPYPYSAAILRRELDAALKVFPQRRPMILIGHSMGGAISRLMITDSGDKLWKQLLPVPPQEMPLTEEEKKILTESLVFSSRPEVGRVVFIATPHRGSKIAAGWVGRLANKLIRAPQQLLALSFGIMTFSHPSQTGREIAKHAPSSVDTLSPNNPFVKAVAGVPLHKGIPYHSIIGDRGKGDTPNSSDGVVPYWSSHIEGAVSEQIAPAGHTVHQNPVAIREVLRILHEHR